MKHFFVLLRSLTSPDLYSHTQEFEAGHVPLQINF